MPAAPMRSSHSAAAERRTVRPVADDDVLVTACLEGSERAWTALIRRYRRLVYSIPVNFGLSAAEADEVFQEVNAKLYENLPRLRDRKSLPAWLAIVARNECRRMLRKSRLDRSVAVDDTVELAEDRDDADRVLHRVQCEHALSRALELLDDRSRRVLQILFLETPRPSYEEIARRLDCPIGSIGPTRARCLEKLHRIYLAVGGPAELEPPVLRRRHSSRTARASRSVVAPRPGAALVDRPDEVVVRLSAHR